MKRYLWLLVLFAAPVAAQTVVVVPPPDIPQVSAKLDLLGVLLEEQTEALRAQQTEIERLGVIPR